MTIEEKLKIRITSEYGTIKNFTELHDLKYSTVASILKRGIKNSNVTNVLKICNALNISADELYKGKIEPIQSAEFHPLDAEMITDYYKYKFEDPNGINLDGIPLSDHEIDFIIIGMDLIIEQVRKNRKRKENKND